MSLGYKSVTGRIFDIQKFSVHDGPGIRTIVFLKGCSLRCRWCCNPESQSRELETMLRAGERALIGKDISAAEVMEDVKKDMPYYRRSGGGLTLSGGETFCQPEFAEALFALSKDSGINTAVETAGNVKWENIERSLPFVDLFLLDIKHTDSGKHREYTGCENGLILENAALLAKNSKVIVRVPTIPGFNDTENEIRNIARFARQIGVSELHLLPYHRLGYDKYVGLGRAYGMGDVPSPTKEKMQMLKEVAENEGLLTEIGG